MISEFLVLEPIRISMEESIYSLLLPDVDDESDRFTKCGTAKLYLKDFKPPHVTISLDDNFQALCIDDVYNRADFAYVVLLNLANEAAVNIYEASLSISDHSGSYSGNLDSL